MFKIVTFKCAILEKCPTGEPVGSLFKDLRIYCLDTYIEKSLGLH